MPLWFFFCGPLRDVCISAPHSSPMTRSDPQSEKNGGPAVAAGSGRRGATPEWENIPPLGCLRSFILLLRCAAPAAAVGAAALGATPSRCRLDCAGSMSCVSTAHWELPKRPPVLWKQSVRSSLPTNT